MAFNDKDAAERIDMLMDMLGVPGSDVKDALMKTARAFFADGRADERRGCSVAAESVMQNALKFRAKETSETGLEFQRGRRVAAEEVMTKISSRSRLLVDQDEPVPEEVLRANEAAAAQVAVEVSEQQTDAGGAEEGVPKSSASGWATGFGATTPKVKRDVGVEEPSGEQPGERLGHVAKPEDDY